MDTSRLVKRFVCLATLMAVLGMNCRCRAGSVRGQAWACHVIDGSSRGADGVRLADVNGDGLDDFLIGAYGDDDGGFSAGQTYLILGRAAADWGMDFDLSGADASF